MMDSVEVEPDYGLCRRTVLGRCTLNNINVINVINVGRFKVWDRTWVGPVQSGQAYSLFPTEY